MRSVIVPLDGSALSEHALNAGVSLALAFGAELHLVHVLTNQALAGQAPPRTLTDAAAARQYLDTVMQRLPEQLVTRSRVLAGNPAEQILQLSQAEPGAVVAMCTHARGALGRLAFGSVADRVMREASTAVTLVRDAPSVCGLRTIVVPLDGSLLAESVLPMATELATRTGATLSLVRVVESLGHPFNGWSGPAAETWLIAPEHVAEHEEQMINDARTYLEGVAERLRGEHRNTVWEVRTGQPASEIIRVAETSPAAITLLATRGHGGIRRWMLGSVSTEIIQHSHCPILVLPPAAVALQET